MDKLNSLKAPHAIIIRMVVLRSVPIKDGKLCQGTIGNIKKQGLLALHLAMMVCIYYGNKSKLLSINFKGCP